jgi:cation transport ATPase/YHS domain-containing protein
MSDDHGHPQAAPAADLAAKVIDPVCGMSVDPKTTPHHAEHAGHTAYFCSAGCRTKFQADPERYMKPEGSSPEPSAAPGAIYTCPMHPEIRQVGPGSCPICGMALEPVTITADDGPNPELADMSRRFWIGLALALPVFVLEMGGHLPAVMTLVSSHLSNWIQFGLATPVVLWAGWPFFQRGWTSLITRRLNMFTLIAMGVGVAWTYSVVAVLAPGLFPPAFRDAMGAVPVYFEAAAVITVLVLLGQVLELRAREQTSGAIKALLNLAPETARRVREDGADEEVTLDLIQVGDRLRVRPGEKIPVDGALTEGRPAVTAVHTVTGGDENALLRLAASLERGSEHPLADAILRAAADRGLSLSETADFDSPVGRGVTGVVEGKKVVLGGAPLMAEQGIDLAPLQAQAETLRQDGTTAVFAAVDGRLAGVLAIADPIKATTAEAVRALKADGVRLVMMTGDNRTTALAVAKQLGIDDVEAEVLPQDKAAVVQKLRAEGRVVAMAGDGVNDAPALAAADVGIAMGAGSDVAIESAGVTLLKGDLQGLVRARRLSRAVMRNIRQNLVFAFVYNVAGVPIAAGVLYPVFGQLLSPGIAAGAMALSSVSVITNALRLRVARL